MARRGDSTQKSVKVLVGAMIGALIVYFVGDAFIYEEGTNGTGFEDGSATAEIIQIGPLILVALGLYGAFQYM
jgi:hypothetical protein